MVTPIFGTSICYWHVQRKTCQTTAALTSKIGCGLEGRVQQPLWLCHRETLAIAATFQTRTMSLLRTCQQPRHAISRSITAYSRVNSTAATPPVQTRDTQEKQSTEITTPPEREVMVADAISGAPGESHLFLRKSTQPGTNVDHLLCVKRSCVIALCVFTSLHEILCKVVDRRVSAGELTGISCKGLVGGRIP